MTTKIRKMYLVPGFARVSAKDAVEMGVQFKVVGVQVGKELVSTKDLGYLDQLVVVVMPVKERFLAKDHTSKHASKTPHIQRIIIVLQIHQQFWALQNVRNEQIIHDVTEDKAIGRRSKESMGNHLLTTHLEVSGSHSDRTYCVFNKKAVHSLANESLAPRLKTVSRIRECDPLV